MKKTWFFAAVVAAVLSSISFGYSGGDGTAGNPYQIADANDLLELAADTANYDKTFILTSNIDMAGRIFTTAVIAPDTDSNGSEFDGIPFTGIFDGQDQTIGNFIIDQYDNDYMGLFGQIGDNGQVKNLGVIDANIQGKDYVGGLAGYNNGTIISSYTMCIVNGSGDFTGGLSGMNHGIISKCHAITTVNGAGFTGGLVGQNDGTIGYCKAAGNVNKISGIDNSYAGGLAGYNNNGIITSCYATGDVNGINNRAGGLIGDNYDGLVEFCYSSGSVTGLDSGNGGLIPYSQTMFISSFWDVQTSGQVGSAAGKGLTSEQMKRKSIYQNAGWADKGWVIRDGIDYPRLNWEDTGGDEIPTAVIPFTGSGTEADPYQIKTVEEFTALSWYFEILDKHIRLMTDLNLTEITLCPIGDLGSFRGVFDGYGHTISNAVIDNPGNGNMGIFRHVDTEGQIKHLNVINANIQGNVFVGGLVGRNEGSVSFCDVCGDVTAGFSAGGLSGFNSGTITFCSATGTVDGKGFSGGFVGQNYGAIIYSSSNASVINGTGDCLGGLVGFDLAGSIIACFATGDVNGTGNNYGGLVGNTLYDTIQFSFATGDVNGATCVGGLIGYDDNSSVNQCYSTGSIIGSSSAGGLIGLLVSAGWFEATECFWDKETSGQNYSEGGSGVQGKTTEEMQALSIFTSAGWDFTNETANGTNNIWRMCVDGVDYPRLNWESVDGDFACPDGVHAEDLDYFVGRWLLENCTADNNYCGGADVDASGKVDLGDFAVLAGHWLEM